MRSARDLCRPAGLLAIPVTLCEGAPTHQYGEPTFSGLFVFSVTPGGGFELVGRLPHLAAGSEELVSYMCHNQWDQPDSLVKRSVFMDDWVFSISPDLVKVASIDDLEHPVLSLPLTAE